MGEAVYVVVDPGVVSVLTSTNGITEERPMIDHDTIVGVYDSCEGAERAAEGLGTYRFVSNIECGDPWPDALIYEKDIVSDGAHFLDPQRDPSEHELEFQTPEVSITTDDFGDPVLEIRQVGEPDYIVRAHLFDDYVIEIVNECIRYLAERGGDGE